MKINHSMLLTVAMLGLSLPAQAMSVKWELSGVVFDDAGTASGSFVYDATTDMYSNVAITTTGGSSFGGTTYSSVLQSFLGTSQEVIFIGPLGDVPGAPVMFFDFGAFLTNAGGTVPLLPPLGPTVSAEEQCDVTFGCGTGTLSVLREVTAGSVIGTPIPLPGAALLFASTLGMMGWVRRKTN